ncbi:MAG: response regulator [Arenicella sp.]
MKLLIVDDSLAMRRKIERCVVGKHNFNIVTASNGVEAVDVFSRELPDAVTMDLTMPKMDGVDCIKRLINIKQDVHILVISALNDKVTSLEAIKNGAEGFLRKPFTDERLAVSINELLEN